MVKKLRWSEEELRDSAKKCGSFRQILYHFGLREAGGNYAQVKKYLLLYKIDTSHFHGKAWNKGLKITRSPRIPIEKVLVKDSFFQSYKLKKRLYFSGLKYPQCELCGWNKRSDDGRIPLELDHINGDSKDNRIENLRILCPNCHSLQPTHRGKNRKRNKIARVAERHTQRA